MHIDFMFKKPRELKKGHHTSIYHLIFGTWHAQTTTQHYALAPPHAMAMCT